MFKTGIKKLTNTSLFSNTTNKFQFNSMFYNKNLSLFNLSSKKGKKNLQPLSSKLENLEFTQDPSHIHLKTHIGKFPYFPINDHPLIPGYARFLPITMKLSEKISEYLDNDETQKFVLSVSKERLSENNQLKSLLEGVNYIPEIDNSDQVFEIGCVCEIKLSEQKEIGNSAFVMPLSICKIESFTVQPKPQDLGEVEAKIFLEEELSEDKLDEETHMKHQFLKKLFEKMAATSKDENFIRLLSALQQNYNLNNLNELIWMAVACLSLPKFFHK